MQFLDTGIIIPIFSSLKKMIYVARRRYGYDWVQLKQYVNISIAIGEIKSNKKNK